MLAHVAAVPSRLGPYTLLERLAEGAVGCVYKAKHTGPRGFERFVAVKTPMPGRREDNERFCAEARLSAQLAHANLAQVLDFDIDQGTPYLVLELLDGVTLADLPDHLPRGARRRIPVGAALAIARDLCLALGYLHGFVDGDGARRPIAHRDVTPANVMICKGGMVKLLDLGRAVEAAPDGGDRRADVGAIATLLRAMLNGDGLTKNPDVPRAVEALLERDFSSGAAMADALERLEPWSRGMVSAWVRGVLSSAPSRPRADDSVKMGIARPPLRIVERPRLVEKIPEPVEAPKIYVVQSRDSGVRQSAAVPAWFDEASTPDLRSHRAFHAAVALLSVGLLGLALAMAWPSRRLVVPPPTVEKPAPRPVVVATPMVKPISKPIVQKPQPRPRVVVRKPPISTVRDGRLVDPFAGGD